MSPGPWFRQTKKVLPIVALTLLLVPAIILVGKRQLSPKASNSVSVQVSPGAINQSSSPQINIPVYLSATAVNDIGQPIPSGITYSWGISSTFPTSPSLKTNDNLATFIPFSTGSGTLWVSAITSESSAIKYVDVCVGVPCPSYTNPTPTSASTPTPAPTDICTRNNPAVSFTPSDQSGIAGSTLSYNYAVTSNDSSSCSPAIISSFTTHNLPSGWNAVFNPTSATINPGQTVNIMASYTSKLGAVPGYYYVYIDPISTLPQYSYNQIGKYAKYTVLSLSPTPTPTPTPISTPTPTPTPTPISNTPPTIIPQFLPIGFVGKKYSASVAATDPDPYDSLTAQITGLPPLLKVTGCIQSSSTPNPYSGVQPPTVRNLVCTISGTPLRSGTFPVKITVTDSANASTTKTVNLFIFKKYILF